MPVPETLLNASLLAIIVNRIVEWWPKKVLIYYWPKCPVDIVIPPMALVVSFAAIWWADINLLPVIQNVVVAKLFTVILCAGGAGLLDDIFGPFTIK